MRLWWIILLLSGGCTTNPETLPLGGSVDRFIVVMSQSQHQLCVGSTISNLPCHTVAP